MFCNIYDFLNVYWWTFENLPICFWLYKKQYPESFAFLILRILEVKFVSFLKNRLVLNAFYSFCMFVNEIFRISAHISRSEKCDDVKSVLYYFLYEDRYSARFSYALVYL